MYQCGETKSFVYTSVRTCILVYTKHFFSPHWYMGTALHVYTDMYAGILCVHMERRTCTYIQCFLKGRYCSLAFVHHTDKLIFTLKCVHAMSINMGKAVNIFTYKTYTIHVALDNSKLFVSPCAHIECRHTCQCTYGALCPCTSVGKQKVLCTQVYVHACSCTQNIFFPTLVHGHGAPCVH